MLNRRFLLATAAGGAAASLLPRALLAQDAALPPRPTPDQWAAAPAISRVSLSPSGNQIVYVTEQNGDKLLHHYNITTKALQAFNVGSHELGGLKWFDEDHVAITTHYALANVSNLGRRGKLYQVSIYNLVKKSQITLFESAQQPGIWTGTLERIFHDGKPCIMSSCVGYDDERQLLVRYALDKNTYDIIDTGGVEVEGWAMTPTGELVGRSEYFTDKRTWVLSYRQGNGWKEIYSHKSELYIPSLLGLGRDGKSLVVSIDSEDKGSEYYEIDANGTLSDPLPAPGISRSAIFDPLTFCLNGFASFDGWFSYHYFDPAMQAIATKAQAAVPGYRMSMASRADDPNVVVVYSEGEDDAGTFYLINFKTGASMELGEAYPDIPPEWITTKQAFTYKAADGLEIEAYLTLPPGHEPKNLPLVVHPHGGPADRDDMSFDWEVQTLASRGYAVLQPNFRGSTGYGEDFERAGDGQVGRKMQTDLSDGVRWLTAKGTIDPKRVCIMGTSYGGYAAFAGATIDIGIYNCAIAIAGLSDATKWLEDERAGMAEVISPAYTYVLRLLGPENTLDEISPIKHVDKVSIPILVMHGKDDSIVPVVQSTMMVNALKAAGKDVTFVEVAHAEHGASNTAARIEMINQIVPFLEKHNPPDPLPT